VDRGKRTRGVALEPERSITPLPESIGRERSRLDVDGVVLREALSRLRHWDSGALRRVELPELAREPPLRLVGCGLRTTARELLEPRLASWLRELDARELLDERVGAEMLLPEV
jgi:hypothetical protein